MAVVLTDIRCKAMWVQNSREKLRERILVQKESAGREKARTIQAELSAINRRLQELDRPALMRLVQKIEINEKYTVDDHEERDIHIYYNFVGWPLYMLIVICSILTYGYRVEPNEILDFVIARSRIIY